MPELKTSARALPTGWGIGADGRTRREEQFWSKVEMREPAVCWPWQGRTSSQGYALYNSEGNAHRVAYRIIVGEIPEGLELDHLCDNPGCVNPYHLEPVTREENMARRSRRQTRCRRAGHEFTEENTRWFRGTRQCKACARERDEKRQGFPRGSRRPRGHREVSWQEYETLAPVIEAMPQGGWVTARLETGRICAWCPPAIWPESSSPRMPEAIR